MRPRLRSYGETSTRTLSPGSTRMRNRRILPARWASSSWSFSSFTRNSKFGRVSVTSPSISSFCSTAIDAFRRRSAGVRQGSGSRGLLHSTPHTVMSLRVLPVMHTALLPSPVGPLYVELEDDRLSALYTAEHALHTHAQAPRDAAFGAIREQVDECFAGSRQ